jgi:choline kinase
MRVVSSLWPTAEFVVVLGHQAARVSGSLPRRVKRVFNADHATTNTARSVAVGLAACRREFALVLYGDLAFTAETLAPLVGLPGPAVLTESGGGRRKEVGVVCHGGEVVNFSFGLDTKWAQAAVLPRREYGWFAKLAMAHRRSRLFTHEVFNEMLDMGARFADVPAGGPLYELDCQKDLKEAREAIRAMAGPKLHGGLE